MNKTVVLWVIVIAQFLCTSIWFAGNAIVNDLIEVLDFPASSVSHLVSSIQLGFICGTLTYALYNIADRNSPSKVFFISAVLAGIANLALLWSGINFGTALISRFLAGFFLAGIYPVGMKIAADYFDKSLGKSLGFLVGALVIGTAFPHFVRSFFKNFPYQNVIWSTSIFAFIGGGMIYFFIPDGPFRKKALKIKMSSTIDAFRHKPFRSAAFGYFGHMWELYSFYTFLPVIILAFNKSSFNTLDISLWSFIIIASGGIGCFITGVLSYRNSPKIIAVVALAISGLCCLFSPFFLQGVPSVIFIIILLIWGTTIAADSPMFSTLVANNAKPEFKGTALTMVNCIGFSLTIVSIQLLNFLQNYISLNYLFIILAAGPVFGLFSMWNRAQTNENKAYLQ